MYRERHFNSTIGIVLSSVPGYSETFFRNKIKGLQDNGFKVVLFVDYFKPTDTEFPCTIITAPDFNKNLFKTFFNVFFILIKSILITPKRSFRLYQYDKKDEIPFRKRMKYLVLNQFLLSQSLDWLHFGFGMLAKNRENVAEAIGAKMAVSFRGFDLYLSPLKHKDCYDLLFLKAVQYHVLSEEMRQTLVDYDISQNKIRVITPAIDVEFFKSQPSSAENEVLQFVTVARLHWKKGLEYTLKAMSLLKQAGIHFQYTIIGEGSERERLIFAAHQLGITENVVFTGKLSPKEVKIQLEQANIYLQYSIQEGFCNAVLEAQAMGVLCVVSNAEGLQENVLHNKTGWVVPKRNPEALTERIIDVIQMNVKQKLTIQQFASTRVKQNFNLEKQNKAFLNFYTD